MNDFVSLAKNGGLMVNKMVFCYTVITEAQAR